jgi:protoporphyrinogen IX oxidase
MKRRGYTWGMLWIKAFHIVFVASWFAGLFYLPRIFVNLAMVPDDSVAERERLLLMARKLLRFTTILSVPAIALGVWLWWGVGIGWGPGNAWMHAKLSLVLLIVGYHHACGRILKKFEAQENTHAMFGTAGSTKRLFCCWSPWSSWWWLNPFKPSQYAR